MGGNFCQILELGGGLLLRDREYETGFYLLFLYLSCGLYLRAASIRENTVITYRP